MEKIKHRTIRFTNPKAKPTPLISALAGIVLGAMAVGLCTMLVLMLR